MIKASDYRIGNLIRDYNGDVAQVAAIDILAMNQCEVANTPIEFIFNIPLSEEWLLKFGFTKHLDPPNDEAFFNLHEVLNLEQINENVYCFDYGGQVQTALISKVHQLQNLIFSLTGRELKLKK